MGLSETPQTLTLSGYEIVPSKLDYIRSTLVYQQPCYRQCPSAIPSVAVRSTRVPFQYVPNDIYEDQDDLI